MKLLDEGTLYVAKFHEDGVAWWIGCAHSRPGPLTEANGFRSQADVVINARLAGDALGATKMDRPEDVQPNPKTGKVYCMLTNNSKRKDEQVDAAIPRGKNKFGHIIERSPRPMAISPRPSRLGSAAEMRRPSVRADVGASFSTATTANGGFGMPDNCAIDVDGRLGSRPMATTGRTPSAPTASGRWKPRGTDARHLKLFFRVPVGAEMCGPCFNPTSDTFFVAVQHPGDAGLPTFETPATRWPDFKDGMPRVRRWWPSPSRAAARSPDL